MTKTDHPLFQKFPISGERHISTGTVPVPYHTYDGNGLFIGGTADLENIQQLLQDEQVRPMPTENGRAIMGIWIVDFTKASLGAHNELQISILVSHKAAQPIEDHPLTLLKALLINPQARMLCWGLWNDTETAVAYNRELLALPARITNGTIEQKNGRKSFHFADADGGLLLEGDITEQKKTPFSVLWSLMRLMGLRQSLRAQSAPYLNAQVVNPISGDIPENLDAQSYLAADTPTVQFFDQTKDTLYLNKGFADTFKFQAQFIEHFAPFRFVYLMPGEKK